MTPASDVNQQREGQAEFRVDGAFYRSESKIARDLAILAAVLEKQRLAQLRILDAMTGCGVRPLRYCLEAGADQVWANEANPDLAPLLQRNLQPWLPEPVKLTHQDARAIFFACYQHRDFYDLVDIDNLTSTDGRSTGGHAPETSLKRFSAYARSHPAVHEQGLRLLIGYAAQTAASRGMGIVPVFSLFTGQVHRAMVRLVRQPTLTEKSYGFIAYCHCCGHFQTVRWRYLGRVLCPKCGYREESAPAVSGPLWLGPLHDVAQVNQMQDVAQKWGWDGPAKLLGVMAQEASLPPYYYPLGAIGHFGAMDIPNRDRLIATLQRQGYRATKTHLDWQAVKTDADFAACVQIAKTCHP